MREENYLPEGEDEVVVNEYYLRISKKLRIAKYLTLLLMVAALILTLWAYRSRLTYDNLRYILRDIDDAGHTAIKSEAVYYTASDTNVYLYFRGDLAVGSSGGVSFHRALGSRSFFDDVKFKSPVITGSDKYMIAYDTGGNSFYVYNSISRVYSETLSHKIIDCAASDGGNFAVLTKNDVGDSLIKLYNKDFKPTGKITRSGYAYSIGFVDGERMYICESYSSGALLYTDIVMYTIGNEDVGITVTVEGIVLDIAKTGKNTAVVTSGGVHFYDSEMKQTAYHSFGTSDVHYASIAKNGVCVLLDKNVVGSAEEIAVYNADGSVYSQGVPYGARGAVLCGKKAVVLYDDRLLVFDAESNRETEIPEGAKKMLLADSSRVIVCYNDYAKLYEVD